MTRAPVLTRDGAWIADDWPVVRDPAAVVSEGEAALLPLDLYLTQSPSAARGVWLSPTDDPAALVPRLNAVPLIAIDFPVFNDGRGYSIAAVLRSRYHYLGDLRAIGDVLIDQLFFLRRVGFTSFLLRADQDRAKAVATLHTFSDAYQGAADDPLPAFRRHARPNARELAEQNDE
jgi:uncharacterized protein (DUF934 family)